ncbi:hypothetical protein CFP71_28350 [Amycolatopsis thailandensis]|uniref:Uncharacterized protein n=1 Tax=Amycolatopsis thailandensis TaxID=589330 RepID=A0A229RUH6_9PSEU|nr:hypothetical protein CFP71_28350 [Amycolatopsis thailandensis]
MEQHGHDDERDPQAERDPTGRAAEADAIPVSLRTLAMAMRADRVHLGSTSWYLFAIMRHYEAQIMPVPPL